MGNCLSGPTSEYVIYVRTGDRKHAGTDANVRIVLHDDHGNCSEEITLDNFLKNDFERGALDQFEVPKKMIKNVKRLGKVTEIEFWRDDAGLGSDWYVDKIIVENKGTNHMFVFPVFRWVREDWHYRIVHLDTTLPQFDKYPDQRRMELDEKKKTYVFAQKAPGMPAQIRSLPPDEQFSNEYKWDIVKTKIQLIATSKIVMLTSGNWDSLSDLGNVYTDHVFAKPLGADRWSNDLFFGLQRVNSLNHSLIELCRSIPEKLPVTDAMLEPLLEGLTIQQALEQKRLFTCDFTILEGLPVRPDFVLCAPIGLFFVDSEKQLRPIAIQLFQKPGPDNPIFLPTDHSLTWALVKMWYNNSDAAYHQALSHLGFTHLLMEGVVVATHRQLSQSHPIFKLLAPHFLYLIAINSRGLELLVCENGWVDKTMNFGMKGMFELIKRGINAWKLDVHGTLPVDLKERGLDDLDVLPCYHFRNDALLHYEAMHKYVKSYVTLYYDTEDKLKEDFEIQAWVAELVKPRDNDKGGCGLLGVPGNGRFTSVDQLITTLTTIIYTCSVSHASTNFPQYEEYGFPPNYPGLLRGHPPKSRNTVVTEREILTYLPDRPTTLDIMIVTKILSQRGTKPIGDFEVQYIFDDRAREIVDEFRKDIAKISEKIKERNKHRNPPYSYLDPDIVPNSISI